MNTRQGISQRLHHRKKTGLLHPTKLVPACFKQESVGFKDQEVFKPFTKLPTQFERLLQHVVNVECDPVRIAAGYAYSEKSQAEALLKKNPEWIVKKGSENECYPLKNFRN